MATRAPNTLNLSEADHDVQVGKPWSLDERSGTLILLLLAPAILVLDYTSGRDFSLQLLYLVPTGLAAWSFGLRHGIVVGLAAAAYWAFVGFSMHHPKASSAALAWDVLSTLALFLFFAFVVARHRAFVDSLHESARLDLASGALAKRELLRHFETEVRRARRYNRPLALVMLDVATQKEWAALGEKVMPSIVRAVHGQIRDSDAVGRLADRRLAIVLVECPPGEAIRVAARIHAGLAAALKVETPPPLGLVSYGGTSAMTAPDMLQEAAAQLANAGQGTGLSENRIP